MAFSLLQLWVLLLVIPSVAAVSFNYPSFNQSSERITLIGNTSFASDTPTIQLTPINVNPDPIQGTVGRAFYSDPIRLYDAVKEADFTTHFSFRITEKVNSTRGDGFTFFLVPNASFLPSGSAGRFLGLFNFVSMFNSSSLNPVVAIEFDTYQNTFQTGITDPSPSHVGIDINSIISVAYLNVSLNTTDAGNVWVSYNSSTKNLSVYLTYARNPVFNGQSSLSYVSNLKELLPEWVYVGFSASTSNPIELHNILSWEFNSTEFPSSSSGAGVGLVIGIAVGVSVLVVGLGLILFFWRRRKRMHDQEEEDEYEKGTGPKRFTYGELSRATNKFAMEQKLGEGGFGSVYRGILKDSNLEIAVKRVSKESRQGKKEFLSEVRCISKLRHRNLVQLLGWCHDRGEFLLVYDYMPNGSLDFHLFKGRTMVTWALRYKIALGLASALLYLHEEWEQCVVHRDIKASNIMLDANFTAKLGDFGLARFGDHVYGVKTTVMAGTMGYIAPECTVRGKTGKKSDVYSFGIVALEIACGRRVVEPKEEDSKVGLVAWVWELYGSGRLLEAADNRLSNDFDEQQMERLLIVGLWCANLDPNLRPPIMQAINVLNFEIPLPNLPSNLSVPEILTPPVTSDGSSMSSIDYSFSGR